MTTGVGGASTRPTASIRDKRSSANYRPEIEGLRAVAAILVAIFHIWVGNVSGGVDVFFVVAGYLTTVTLLGHLSRTGRVSVPDFLTRLAARLFPASIVVLLVVAITTPLLLVSSQWKQTFTEVLASALYVENWWLLRSGNDYLARDNFSSPVQNFWAMSAQGQFYILWLAFFLVAGLITWTRLARDRHKIVAVIIAAATAASFIFAVHAVDVNQSQAYYNTFARVWEFGLGSLCALLLTSVVISKAIRAAMGWIGLGGIVLCGFVLNAGATFPGPWALWPTTSAVLIIVAGAGGSVKFGVQSILARRPLVWFGGISYCFYLWHWPILIFVIETSGERPDLLSGLAIITAAGVLAWLTNLLVEKPVVRWIANRPNTIRKWSPVAALAVLALFAGGALTATTMAVEDDLARTRVVAEQAGPCFGATAIESFCSDVEWEGSVPKLDPAADLSSLETRRCRTSVTGLEVKECTFGVIGSDERVLLIGNSHAASLFPALEELAEQNGWEITTFYKSNCVFNTSPRYDESEEEMLSCLEWGDRVRERISEMPPFLFALNSHSARKSIFLDSEGLPSDEAGIQGFKEAWAPLIAEGTPILAVADNPVVESGRELSCMYRPEAAEECVVARAEAFADRDLMIAAAQTTEGAYPLDMSDVYCGKDSCHLVIGGVKVLRDRGHLTATFARTLAPLIEQAFEHIEAEKAR